MHLATIDRCMARVVDSSTRYFALVIACLGHSTFRISSTESALSDVTDLSPSVASTLLE